MAASAKFDWHPMFEEWVVARHVASVIPDIFLLLCSPVFVVSNVLLVSSPPALTLAQVRFSVVCWHRGVLMLLRSHKPHLATRSNVWSAALYSGHTVSSPRPLLYATSSSALFWRNSDFDFIAFIRTIRLSRCNLFSWWIEFVYLYLFGNPASLLSRRATSKSEGHLRTRIIRHYTHTRHSRKTKVLLDSSWYIRLSVQGLRVWLNFVNGRAEWWVGTEASRSYYLFLIQCLSRLYYWPRTLT